MILNEDLVKKIGLRRWQIDHEAGKVRTEIKHRMLLYRGDRPLPIISGRSVVIIDDGLASGITMTAAVESVRHRHPKHIIVGVPCASAIAIKQLERIADKVITCAVGYMPRFAVADYYRYWYDVDDDEVVQYLKQWQVRQFWSNNKSS
jgi:predicted phosphoribosyltransferase